MSSSSSRETLDNVQTSINQMTADEKSVKAALAQIESARSLAFDVAGVVPQFTTKVKAMMEEIKKDGELDAGDRMKLLGELNMAVVKAERLLGKAAVNLDLVNQQMRDKLAARFAASQPSSVSSNSPSPPPIPNASSAALTSQSGTGLFTKNELSSGGGEVVDLANIKKLNENIVAKLMEYQRVLGEFSVKESSTGKKAAALFGFGAEKAHQERKKLAGEAAAGLNVIALSIVSHGENIPMLGEAVGKIDSTIRPFLEAVYKDKMAKLDPQLDGKGKASIPPDKGGEAVKIYNDYVGKDKDFFDKVASEVAAQKRLSPHK
jgi:hypothetical protein